MAEKKLRVTLVKSTIGAVPKNKKTVEALGLRKVNKTVELPDNDKPTRVGFKMDGDKKVRFAKKTGDVID